MNLRSIPLFLVLLLILPAARGQTLKPALTSDIEQYRDSIVRIIAQNDKDSDNGIAYDSIKLDNGTSYPEISWSSGTGFVVNHDGYIFTNNHVVATDPLSRTPSKLLLVVETITQPSGKIRVVHKAKVVWLAPEYDVAVIQCSGLRCKPIPLDLTPPQQGDVVHSLGFPAMSDMISTNRDKEAYVEGQVRDRVASMALKEFEDKAKREPTKDEAEAMDAKLDDVVYQLTQFTEFETCLTSIADAINPTWKDKDSWNITDVVNRNSWHNYFDATRTDGSIQNVADASSFTSDTQATFTMIQHSLVIQHGNSGGPLMSDRGGVLGVVGRGFNVKRAENDIENVNYAASINVLTKWLGSDPDNRHYYKLVPMKSTLIYLTIAVLIVAAFALLGFGVLSRRTAPIPLITSADRGITPPQLNHGSPPSIINTIQTPGRPMLTAVTMQQAGGGWKLTSCSPGSRSFSVEFNDAMLSRNDNRLIIGRSPDLCHLVMPTDDVSRQHSHIRREGTQFFIADRNSSNRTAVNGQFTGAPFAEVALSEGQVITLGEVKVQFTRA